MTPVSRHARLARLRVQFAIEAAERRRLIESGDMKGLICHELYTPNRLLRLLEVTR